MAKLYFRYGTVGSAKTLNLLAVAHNYRQQRKKVLLLKPALDTRFGRDVIKTRAGLEAVADALLPDTGLAILPSLDDVVCVLVDEVQFVSVEVIDQLYGLAHACTYPPYNRAGIPVICYGLRTDFRRVLFPAARRLMELADSIEEVKTTCTYCLQKATFNLKLRDGLPVTDGPAVELGCEELYVPVCGSCYEAKHSPQHKRSIAGLSERAVWSH
jgi:thymidine kinase